MCKYCDVEVEQCGEFILQGEHDETGTYIYRSADGFFLVNNQDDTDETEIDFCPKCGTPLGEVKPLTVEHLKEINADIENRKWIYIKCLVKFPYDYMESAYYRSQSDYTGASDFCCGYPGLAFSFAYSDYGTTWIAYLQEPNPTVFQEPSEYEQATKMMVEDIKRITEYHDRDPKGEAG